YFLFRPFLGCVTGSCMITWAQYDGETNEFSKNIYQIYGRRFSGMTPLEPAPYRVSRDIDWIGAMTAGSSGYLVTGMRINHPADHVWGADIVVARAAADGTPVDERTVTVENGAPPEGYPYGIIPSNAIFDGDSYIVTWEDLGPSASASACYAFAARVGTSG